MSELDLESAALFVLRGLVNMFGLTVVQGVFNILLGSSGGMIVEPASEFIASILRAVLDVTDESRVKDELEAMFNAADAVADAAEKAKFGG